MNAMTILLFVARILFVVAKAVVVSIIQYILAIVILVLVTLGVAKVGELKKARAAKHRSLETL